MNSSAAPSHYEEALVGLKSDLRIWRSTFDMLAHFAGEQWHMDGPDRWEVYESVDSLVKRIDGFLFTVEAALQMVRSELDPDEREVLEAVDRVMGHWGSIEPVILPRSRAWPSKVSA